MTTKKEGEPHALTRDVDHRMCRWCAGLELRLARVEEVLFGSASARSTELKALLRQLDESKRGDFVLTREQDEVVK